MDIVERAVEGQMGLRTFLGLKKGRPPQPKPILAQVNHKRSKTTIRATGVGTSKEIRRHMMFRAYLGSVELVDIVKAEGAHGRSLLDIGGAYGVHARYFRSNLPGLKVDLVDTHPADEPLIFSGYYSDFQAPHQYDYIWSSHVLEHIPNPGDFFSKLHRDLKDGGWAAITVPPLKHDMTFAHVTLWNAGLLLIHFIKAGFDCTNARVATYGYNVTVIAQKNPRNGKREHASLPPGIVRRNGYFEGQIPRLNWKNAELPMIDAADKSISGFFSTNGSLFYRDATANEEVKLA